MFELSLLQREVTRLLDLELSSSGLSAEDFAVYSAVARGLTRPGDIAEFLRFPATTVSSVVRRLATRGHVTCAIDDADRRARRVTFTPAGAAAHAEASRLYGAALKRLHLPASAQSIERLLVEMRTVIADAQKLASAGPVAAGRERLS
jgi:DNA-binding MarR family transcriptional regulator